MLQKYLNKIQDLVIGERNLTEEELMSAKVDSVSFLLINLDEFIKENLEISSTETSRYLDDNDLEGYLTHTINLITKIPDFDYKFDAYINAAIINLKYQSIKKARSYD